MDNNFAQVNVEIAVRAGLFGPLEITTHGRHIHRYAGLTPDSLNLCEDGIQAKHGLDAVLRARFGRASIGPCEVCWDRAVVYATKIGRAHV